MKSILRILFYAALTLNTLSQAAEQSISQQLNNSAKKAELLSKLPECLGTLQTYAFKNVDDSFAQYADLALKYESEECPGRLYLPAPRKILFLFVLKGNIRNFTSTDIETLLLCPNLYQHLSSLSQNTLTKTKNREDKHCFLPNSSQIDFIKKLQNSNKSGASELIKFFMEYLILQFSLGQQEEEADKLGEIVIEQHKLFTEIQRVFNKSSWLAPIAALVTRSFEVMRQESLFSDKAIGHVKDLIGEHESFCQTIFTIKQELYKSAQLWNKKWFPLVNAEYQTLYKQLQPEFKKDLPQTLQPVKLDEEYVRLYGKEKVTTVPTSLGDEWLPLSLIQQKKKEVNKSGKSSKSKKKGTKKFPKN